MIVRNHLSWLVRCVTIWWSNNGNKTTSSSSAFQHLPAADPSINIITPGDKNFKTFIQIYLNFISYINVCKNLHFPKRINNISVSMNELHCSRLSRSPRLWSMGVRLCPMYHRAATTTIWGMRRPLYHCTFYRRPKNVPVIHLFKALNWTRKNWIFIKMFYSNYMLTNNWGF